MLNNKLKEQMSRMNNKFDDFADRFNEFQYKQKQIGKDFFKDSVG